jgi:dipeptidyl aminopeptidase/acylaminoacyl peptidase
MVAQISRRMRDSPCVHIRLVAAGFALLVASACTGGSSRPKLEQFVAAPRVDPELALAHADTGFPLVGTDGRSLGVLRVPGALENGSSPAWSPDGTRIAFTAATGARASGALLPPTDVYVMGVQGGAPHRVTTGRNALYPEWSPDGRWIEYSAVTRAGDGRTAALWIVHPDGTGATRLTHPANGAYDLAGPYNPRTGRIAFTRCAKPKLLTGGMEPDTCSVWTMNPDASGQRRLASESEQPAWSPDGRRIVFASARDHARRVSVGEDEQSWIRQIYVMGADGSGQHRFAETATDDRWPDWAPGGTVIAYEASGGVTTAATAVVVNADGTCARTVSPRLTGHLDIGYHTPAWRPGGVAARLTC